MCDDIEYRKRVSDHLDNAWITFMATFGRFEYALKEAGYIAPGKAVKISDVESGHKASANWDTFAGVLTNEFFVDCQKNESLVILFEAPPKIRIVVGAELGWADTRSVTNVTQLFQVVRDVRNSLFHGDKHLYQDRDHKLIRAAQRVLDYAMAKAKSAQDKPKLALVYEKFKF